MGPPIYFEHNIHDNLCVVHSLNNLLQNKVITRTKLLNHFKHECKRPGVNMQDHFDIHGFALVDVLDYLRRKKKYHFFKLSRPFRFGRTTRYLLSIRKSDYNHMVCIVDGYVLDNEESEAIPYDDWRKIFSYKILDAYRFENKGK